MTTRPAPPDGRAPGFVSGNVYDKYRTRNPLYRVLMARFLGSCQELLASVRAERLLEVGCGPGDLAAELLPRLGWSAEARYLGSDVSLAEVHAACSSYPERRFLPASIYRLPVPDKAFDGVIACEVFEHLEEPGAALAEIERVASGFLLLSVPWEPIWRLLNLARGQYLGDLGNTPGHVQHFSRAAIRRLVASRFDIVGERRPLPWTVLLARARRPAAGSGR